MRRLLPRRPLLIFVAWGLTLSVLQAGLEGSAAVHSLTVGLAHLLLWFLPRFGIPASADGTALRFLGTTQEVTPNCLGLAGIAVYTAAVLATPAAWGSRARGVGLGLALITGINAIRFLTFGALLNVSAGAFRFTHVVAWGAFVPLVLLGIWGLWVVRGLRLLPAYPLRVLLRVVLVLPLLVAAWYYALDRYLIAVVTAVNSVLTATGVPVSSVSLVQVDLYRYLNAVFANGEFRLELAASSVTPVAFLTLVVASPVSLAQRASVALAGVAVLFVLLALGTAGIVFVGRTAPAVLLPSEIFNDFLNLAAPATLWLFMLGHRLAASRLRGSASPHRA